MVRRQGGAGQACKPWPVVRRGARQCRTGLPLPLPGSKETDAKPCHPWPLTAKQLFALESMPNPAPQESHRAAPS